MIRILERIIFKLPCMRTTSFTPEALKAELGISLIIVIVCSVSSCQTNSIYFNSATRTWS